jgi:hypothetical protein
MGNYSQLIKVLFHNGVLSNLKSIGLEQPTETYLGLKKALIFDVENEINSDDKVPNIFDSIINEFKNCQEVAGNQNNFLCETFSSSYNDLFNAIRPYNQYIKQDIYTLSDIFKGKFSFLTENKVIQFFENKSVDEDTIKSHLTFEIHDLSNINPEIALDFLPLRSYYLLMITLII